MELEQVLHRENLNRAWRRVVSNGGAPGVDGMPVEALGVYLKEHGPRIREALISGAYEPQPVRRVEIPKPDGKGTRTLGIPTVLDRFIQQAILQVLTPQVDPHSVSGGIKGKGSGREAEGKGKNVIMNLYFRMCHRGLTFTAAFIRNIGKEEITCRLYFS